MTSSQPAIKQRALLWLLFVMLSSGFAETISGSTLFPFNTPAGLFPVLPLYLLHRSVLTTIVSPADAHGPHWIAPEPS
jgi:hypothetical protein